MIKTSQIEKYFILNRNKITNYWIGKNFFVERDGISVKYPYYNFENYSTDELVTDIILKLNSEGKKKITFNPIDEKDELRISTDCSSLVVINKGLSTENSSSIYYKNSSSLIRFSSDISNEINNYQTDYKLKKDSIRKKLIKDGII